MVLTASKKQKCMTKGPTESELVELIDNVGFIKLYFEYFFEFFHELSCVFLLFIRTYINYYSSLEIITKARDP